MRVILTNGIVLTMSEQVPIAEAVVAENGRIVYVGKSDEALRLANEASIVFDLDGKTVLPGLIDTHLHLLSFGFSLARLNLRDSKSIDEVVEKIRLKAEDIGPGGWIIGRGWDQDRLEERRFPTRWDLDRGTTENPVVIVRVCGHACVVNSRALEEAGLTTWRDVPGGRMGVDDEGELTGMLFEEAEALVLDKIPPPTQSDAERAIEDACTHALESGLTCVHTVSCTRDEFKALQSLHSRGRLPLRVRVYFDSSHLISLLNVGMKTGFGDDHLKVMGVKVIQDGSLGARTARLSKPYSDDPSTMGIFIYEGEALEDLVQKSHDADLQIAIHAIGDDTVAAALSALEKATSGESKIRHRIEHVSVLTEDLVGKLAGSGAVAAVQPHFIVSDFWAVDRVGEERAKFVYLLKTLLDEGVTVVGGSDCPVEPISPFKGIYAAVTRGIFEDIRLQGLTTGEELSVDEAIRLYTTYAAMAAMEEDRLGSIEVGKLADMIVLRRNPLEVPPKELKEMRPDMVIVGGKVVGSVTETTNH